jgi:serine/threonine-protein kinase RsbW
MSVRFDQVGPVLVLTRNWAEMQRFSDWLNARLEALALAGEAAYAVRLCLEEAISNVIMHAAGSSAIHVTLDRKEDGLIASVEDNGPAFDPVSATPLPSPGSIEAASNGGFGLRLIRGYAQSMDYQRTDGTNRLELRFHG